MACLCSRAAQGSGGCMREVGRPRNRAAAQACRPGNAGKAPAQCGGGLRACPNLALAGVNTIRQPQGVCRARSKVHQHCLQPAGLKAGLCSSESQPRCRAALTGPSRQHHLTAAAESLRALKCTVEGSQFLSNIQCMPSLYHTLFHSPNW